MTDNSRRSGVTRSAHQHPTVEQLIDRIEHKARELPDYSDQDEISTGRIDVPPNALPSIHVHLDSVHESEPPAKKQIKSGLVALGTGAVAALITALLALLQRCAH
jgi:hypothetical protein